MVGPDQNAQGGISSLLKSYAQVGFPRDIAVTSIVTSAGDSAGQKIGSLISGSVAVFGGLLLKEWDVIHIHMSQGMSFWRKAFLGRIASLAGVPVVLHIHGSSFERLITHGPSLQRIVTRKSLAAADVVIVLSEVGKSRFSELVPKANVVAVPNGVTIPPFSDLHESGPIVSTGLLGTRKGSFTIVSAAKALPDAEFVLAGNGEITAVRDAADSAGVAERVKTPGWIGPDEREGLLRKSSIYILPSSAEGLPIGLLEAMSFGLPVVTTPIGGIPDVIENGRNGLLIPPDDPEALSSALQTLIGDFELRQRLGRAARDTVESGYTVEANIASVTALYRSLATTPGS